MEDYISIYLQNYFLPLITIVNGFGLQIKKASTLDYIIFSATALTVVDSIPSPMIYGRTIHDLIGLMPGKVVEQEIIFYESVAIGAANVYMFVRNFSKKS